MVLAEFDKWAKERLEFSETDGIDASMNGVQVGNAGAGISKIAFAVDACMDSFRRAVSEGAQLLFVHHGLFWGPAIPLTGVHGERVRFLVENNLGLYACHLPLDRHGELGNNAQMARALGLVSVEPFGLYRGKAIGVKGRLESPVGLEKIVSDLFGHWDSRIDALRFGGDEIGSVGIISGGGPGEVRQAISQGLDLYITGDKSHNIYHECREAGINVLFAGHYLSEVFGIRAVGMEVAETLNLETVFLDIPTGY